MNPQHHKRKEKKKKEGQEKERKKEKKEGKGRGDEEREGAKEEMGSHRHSSLRVFLVAHTLRLKSKLRNKSLRNPISNVPLASYLIK
jgi:hypothetical protein